MRIGGSSRRRHRSARVGNRPSWWFTRGAGAAGQHRQRWLTQRWGGREPQANQASRYAGGGSPTTSAAGLVRWYWRPQRNRYHPGRQLGAARRGTYIAGQRRGATRSCQSSELLVAGPAAAGTTRVRTHWWAAAGRRGAGLHMAAATQQEFVGFDSRVCLPARIRGRLREEAIWPALGSRYPCICLSSQRKRRGPLG